MSREDIIRIHDKLDMLDRRTSELDRTTAVLNSTVQGYIDGNRERIVGIEKVQEDIKGDVQFLKDWRRDIRSFILGVSFVASTIAAFLTLIGQYLYGRLNG